MDLTEDAFLGGRVMMRQPCSGPRAGIDPVLLAAAIPARASETVLDVGTGSGVVALCLLARIPGLRVCGLELDPHLAALARDNAARNPAVFGHGGVFTVVEGNLCSKGAAGLDPNTFHHVAANPPFGQAGRGTAPPDGRKAAAHVENEASLDQWIDYCFHMARPRGTVTLVHRADRLDQLVARLHGRVGDLTVIPLWPRAGKPARRVIVQGIKGASGVSTLHPGLVLHREGARDFTAEADAILRRGAGFPPACSDTTDR